MRALILSLALAISVNSAADTKAEFTKMEGQTKGPFALNYLQGTGGRTTIKEPIQKPDGKFLFQAAFRNDIARKLAETEDFYIGNLFTTNYYELTGRYVYNDPYGSFNLDHAALAAKASQASEQIAAMVRSWVLERSYTSILPSAKLSRSFAIRGISGSEFELEYAYYFFNLAITATTEEYQFLPLFLLAKTSPLSDSTALDKARIRISQTYDTIRLNYGDKSNVAREMYVIRNTIHNQISMDVIGKMSSYLKKYSDLPQVIKTDISQIQAMLVDYYNIGPSKVLKIAEKIKETEAIDATKAIIKNGFTAELGLKLSVALVNIKNKLVEHKYDYNAQTDALTLLTKGSQYLNKETGSLKSIKGTEVQASLTALNLVYIEGFMIRDNYEYFAEEFANATPQAIKSLIPDLVEISMDTLSQSFEPGFAQWLSVEPKMQYFTDNTIKSSSLNTLSLLAEKIK